MNRFDITIGGTVFTETDEYTMTVGKKYLVFSERTGYFLGTYTYANRTLGAYEFVNCTCYETNYYGDLVLSDKPVRNEVVSMVHIIARENISV